MQRAGFKTVLIYNQIGEHKDATVRMSAHSLGDDVVSFSAFLSRSQGQRLLSLIRSNPSIAFLTIKDKNTEWLSKQLILDGVVDMAVLFLLVVITGTSILFFGLILNFFHNYRVHGTFKVVETIHEASLIILAVANQTPSSPKLKTIPFPTRILAECDLVNEWRCGGIKGQDSCPICIEEFQIGDQVRELPCRHSFHDTWYIQLWLT